MKDQQKKRTVRKNSSSKKKISLLQKYRNSSLLVQGILFAVVIGVLGSGYLLYRTFAAGTPDYKVRFIAVIPQGDDVPGWATNGDIKANALAIQSWYTKRVGKSFAIATGDTLNFKWIRGTKTKAGYKVCPSNFKCPDGAPDAIVANLYNQYHKAGMSTVIFTSFDPFVSKNIYSTATSMNPFYDSTNVKDAYGYIKNYGAVAVNFTGSRGNYVGDAKARRYTAHELGHNMGLGHVCNKTLMNVGQGVNGCSYIATAWPNTPLQSSQADALRANSRFFNDL